MTLVAPKNPQRPSIPAREPQLSRREQLAVLADLADKAVALRPAADSAVSQCGVVGAVPNEVGLELGRLSRSYSLVYERARHLPVDAALTGARAELLRLLSYHMHMLRDAGDLAFSARADERTEPFRRELAQGLGPFATELVVLADDFRRRVVAPVEPVFEDWGAPDEILLEDVDLSADEP